MTLILYALYGGLFGVFIAYVIRRTRLEWRYWQFCNRNNVPTMVREALDSMPPDVRHQALVNRCGENYWRERPPTTPNSPPGG